MRVSVKEMKDYQPVTVSESQATIAALADAKSLGAKFHLLGGGHLAGTKMIKSFTLKTRRLKREKLEKEKSKRFAAEEIEEEALAILEKETDELKQKKLTGRQLKVVLQFYGVEKKEITGKKVNVLRKK